MGIERRTPTARSALYGPVMSHDSMFESGVRATKRPKVAMNWPSARRTLARPSSWTPNRSRIGFRLAWIRIGNSSGASGEGAAVGPVMAVS